MAVNVYNKYVNETGDKTPCVIASTASPYKFCKTVARAVKCDCPDDEFETAKTLNRFTGVDIPRPISELEYKKVRFNDSIEVSKMPDYVINNA